MFFLYIDDISTLSRVNNYFDVVININRDNVLEKGIHKA